MPASSITVIMPALNEEDALEASVQAVQTALEGLGEFEIILFDDGSTDRTGPLVDELAARFPNVRAAHNPGTRGMGYSYARGVEMARYEYVVMVPGDDETPISTIRAIAEQAGTADIVLTYTANQHEVRPLHRRWLSKAFTLALNLLFGLRLPYYNGTCLIRTRVVRTVPLETNGFAYMATLLIRLSSRGFAHQPLGIALKPREGGKSKALTWRSLLNVAKALIPLVWEVRLGRERARTKASSASR